MKLKRRDTIKLQRVPSYRWLSTTVCVFNIWRGNEKEKQRKLINLY